jgi:hypothetical protein
VPHGIRKSSKAIPVTRRGGLHGCEMLRISRFSGQSLTDGGKEIPDSCTMSRWVVNFTLRPLNP